MRWLIVLFAIGFSGVAVILACAVAAERTGKRYFLPERVYERDAAIADAARRATNAVRENARTFAARLARGARERAAAAFTRAAARLRARPTLQKNGTATAYLSELAQHKQAIRENGIESASRE